MARLVRRLTAPDSGVRVWLEGRDLSACRGACVCGPPWRPPDLARVRWFLAVLVLLGGMGRSGLAQAHTSYSDFEWDTIQRALGDSPQVETNPEGKFIEAIEIYPQEVFDDRDPVPDILNLLHTTTRKRIARQELLVDVGQRYRTDLVEQSERNLRAFPWLSLVLVVPVRSVDPSCVRLAVIVRDIWSLRTNTNLQLTDGYIRYLLLNPSENNLFGLHARLGGKFVLEQDSYSVGGLAAYPRAFGSRINVEGEGNAIFNRDTGKGEGSFGSFVLRQPLYSLDSKWAGGVASFWRQEVTRRFLGRDIAEFDAEVSPDVDDAIPIVYQSRRVALGAQGVRSFGRRVKADLAVGFEVDVRRYRARTPALVDALAAQEFIDSEVPVSDTRIGPHLQLQAFTNDFLNTLDVEAVGLQENLRLGPHVLLRFYPAASKLGSTRTLLGIYAGASHTLKLRDGFARALVANNIELADESRHDGLLEGSLRVMTPRLGLGRLTTDIALKSRYRNYLRRQFTLGGENRLRGYEPGAFVGPHLLAGTLEFRSTSINVLSTQAGLALFYDAGDAGSSLRALDVKQSLGIGVRMLLPQISRRVLRADFAVPVSSRGFDPGGFFLTFEQAFELPELLSPSIAEATEAPETTGVQ